MKRTNKLIASVLVVVMLLTTLMVSLASCGEDSGSGSGNSGTGKTVTYSVTVSTKAGMPFEKLPVYVYEYEDGSLGDLVDNGYGATDANGKVSFNLPDNKQYAVKISSIPSGYDVKSFYPLVSANLEIVLSSSVIADTDLNGVSYTLGSVMHDFSVTTTTGEIFTLSEVLKEKKAVLINFWYSTCGPCVSEFPLMVEAYEKYKDDLAIIALNPPETAAQDTLDDIKMFKSTYGLTFDVAQDLDGLNRAFGVSGFPTSVMVDRYGVVTVLHTGSITSERVFDVIFNYFTGDDYKQILVKEFEDIVPKEKPDVEMPSSEEISNVFDKGNIGGVEYLPYRDDVSADEKEYSWPFVIDSYEGVDCIRPSNTNKEGSFAQILFNVPLKAGEVLAFDYLSSTEKGADILYVVVDGKDIYSISGPYDRDMTPEEKEKAEANNDWSTCYTFVAVEDGTYEVGIVYQKDSSDNLGDDTVYLKNLRIVSESDIDKPTFIYRFAATNPDKYNRYQDYIEPVYNSNDGYYHVNSVNGPILLANLMGYTRFDDDNTVYYMAVEMYEDRLLTDDEFATLIDYCNYASNATIYGASSVTPELEELLVKIANYYGVSSNTNDWLRLCFYYDAYATGGLQLEDPIKGLCFASAYDVILSSKGSNDFPNSFTYDRMIMPRGLIAKFTPTQSGTYRITSNSEDPNNPGYGLETDAWVFTDDGQGNRVTWYTYENIDRMNKSDVNNCYMTLYLEAGKDYYIDIAYYDVYQEGTINYRVERLGGEGTYTFSLASPGYFTTEIKSDGSMSGWIIHGGIDVVKGNDGIWREKRTDGRTGSILYADFTMVTPIFENGPLGELIEKGIFDFSVDEDGKPVAGGEDLTALAREIYNRRIKVGYNSQLGETIQAGDERIGCVIVTDDVAILLQKLMDKYTLMNGDENGKLFSIENSWTKLCYYHKYYCAATPK